jgi:alanyl-tRNA synthetase
LLNQLPSIQELGQADISVLKKAELRDRLAVIRKAVDKQVKEREAAANREVVVESIRKKVRPENIFSGNRYHSAIFQRQQESRNIHRIAQRGWKCESNCSDLVGLCHLTVPPQILQAVISQGRKLQKAVYVFSTDPESNTVAHVNYVPPEFKTKGADARTWASKVVGILGGKVIGYANGTRQYSLTFFFL